MGKDNLLCVKCGGLRYSGQSLCSSCREEEAGSFVFADSCPWPTGNKLERGFPCGVRYVDAAESEDRLQFIPGRLLKEFYETEDIDLFFESGEEVRDQLKKAIDSKEEESGYVRLTEKCVDCLEADWQNFASRMSRETL